MRYKNKLNNHNLVYLKTAGYSRGRLRTPHTYYTYQSYLLDRLLHIFVY